MRLRRTLSIAVLTACAATTAGCGNDEPTTQSMCEYFYDKGAEFRKPYLGMDAEKDPLGSLAMTLGAQGDLAAFFHGLADHSPADIRADVEAVADAFGKAADSNKEAFSNPLGAIGGGLLAGLGAMQPMNRVNGYLQQNCGPPPAD